MSAVDDSSVRGDAPAPDGSVAALPGGRMLRDRGFRPGDDRTRVEAYQRRFQSPLDLLALVTIWFVVVPPGVITGDHELYLILVGLRFALSAVYAVDIIARSALAPRHLYYLTHNLLSIATVFFPFLRLLFSLRLLRSIFQRGSIGRFVLAASLMFLNLTAVVYFFERNAPHANIKTWGEALWWAIVTLTTVGYGDYTPVTWQGRAAAVLLMFVGFAVLATITAQIASSYIDQAARARAREPGGADATQDREAAEFQAISDQLRRLEERIDRLAPPPPDA